MTGEDADTASYFAVLDHRGLPVRTSFERPGFAEMFFPLLSVVPLLLLTDELDSLVDEFDLHVWAAREGLDRMTTWIRGK